MIPVVAFFNNKSGSAAPSLVYNTAWKLADLGFRVLAADLDPQANLTGDFLEDAQLAEIWPQPPAVPPTIFGSLIPLIKGTGDVGNIPALHINSHLSLVPGDIGLSSFEDELSAQWSRCLDGHERAFRVTSAFWRVLQRAARESGAQVILMELGPNLGAINRAAFIAADHVVVSVAPDLYSLHSLRYFGPSILKWRADWHTSLGKNPEPSLDLPKGEMAPAGYVVFQQVVRPDGPLQASAKWMSAIPLAYARFVLGLETTLINGEDSNRIAILRHYRGVTPMAQAARKPIFHLNQGDGALGSQMKAVNAAGKEFGELAIGLMARIGLEV
jgi:cellulose biosynthesis protein BcsQ